MLLILHKDAIIQTGFRVVNPGNRGHCLLTAAARAAMFRGRAHAPCGKQMRGIERWMLWLPMAPSIIGVALASASPVTPDAAEAAIADAEASVRLAETARALWTSAEDALRKARSALREGDATMAVEQARIARKQSELGITQKSYPLFR
jgi:hypothetical protein